SGKGLFGRERRSKGWSDHLKKNGETDSKTGDNLATLWPWNDNNAKLPIDFNLDNLIAVQTADVHVSHLTFAVNTIHEIWCRHGGSPDWGSGISTVFNLEGPNATDIVFDHLGITVDCPNFFFSSRRRHTRLVSDWSSDVCSSD